MKKAMQLSMLSNCEISLKIFWKEDGSLLEYLSDSDHIIEKRSKLDKEVKQFAKFHNKSNEIFE